MLTYAAGSWCGWQVLLFLLKCRVSCGCVSGVSTGVDMQSSRVTRDGILGLTYARARPLQSQTATYWAQVTDLRQLCVTDLRQIQGCDVYKGGLLSKLKKAFSF